VIASKNPQNWQDMRRWCFGDGLQPQAATQTNEKPKTEQNKQDETISRTES
jgi:hypothetical protein